jgi:hypothetical protein
MTTNIEQTAWLVSQSKLVAAGDEEPALYVKLTDADKALRTQAAHFPVGNMEYWKTYKRDLEECIVTMIEQIDECAIELGCHNCHHTAHKCKTKRLVTKLKKLGINIRPKERARRG